MAVTWDNRDGRKLYLSACLEHWQKADDIRGDWTGLALTRACLRDYGNGLKDCTPWLAMADWLEETEQYYTGVLRESIDICFASYSSSSS